MEVSPNESLTSTSRSSSDSTIHRFFKTDSLLNMLKREESVNSAEGGGFHAKYEPREVLGRGLSSTVRKCVSRDTGLEYAVKIIDKSQEEAITESIQAEMQVLHTLPPHKHIINLQDVFESNAFIFMVFELATGGELFDYLTQMVKLSEKKTRQIMYQVLQAVEHMHSHNVVHRDLKSKTCHTMETVMRECHFPTPENILLDEQLNVKISDFGFSVFVQEGQQLSELLGTPGYLAPEMLRRSVEAGAPGYNKEIDLWACGVIMYTLLVGFPPFWHRKQLVMLRSIMEGRYEFVSPEWDDISDQAKDMIRKLLVTDPRTRLTAYNALSHPFLQIQPVDFVVFSARRKFRAVVFGVLSCFILEKMRKSPKTITLASIGQVPYDNRFVRSLIDACAFHVYGHWVKRGEEQNRAALFETVPKKLSPDSTTSLREKFGFLENSFETQQPPIFVT